MAQSGEIYRHFVVCKADPGSELSRMYLEAHDRRWLERYIARHVVGVSEASPPFRIVALPSRPSRSRTAKAARAQPTELVVALDVDGSSAVDALVAAVRSSQNRDVFLCSSPDLQLGSAEHWCPNEATDPIFANRSAAERLMHIDYLRERHGKVHNRKTINTSGAGVNVVIVDQGLNAEELGESYADGWPVGAMQPGTAGPSPGSVQRGHGMMIAHNILATAPAVNLFDLPLMPHRTAGIAAFLSAAQDAFRRMIDDIVTYSQGNGKYSGPWILVNPWGIFDTSSEYPRGDYTNNPDNCFNRLVVEAVQSGIDVIFSAGNCGQFCPDRRCGPTDRGPGFSIWGANSLMEVLTVGAVRADSMWLGYSAQGPGQSRLETRKPDLCAASQFRETADAAARNSGTSAACAMAAGVVAALRSTWTSAVVPPGQLKAILCETARKPAGWQDGNQLMRRFGNGILDAKAAFEFLP